MQERRIFGLSEARSGSCRKNPLLRRRVREGDLRSPEESGEAI